MNFIEIFDQFQLYYILMVLSMNFLNKKNKIRCILIKYQADTDKLFQNLNTYCEQNLLVKNKINTRKKK